MNTLNIDLTKFITAETLSRHITWDSTEELMDKDWFSGCLATAFPVRHS